MGQFDDPNVIHLEGVITKCKRRGFYKNIYCRIAKNVTTNLQRGKEVVLPVPDTIIKQFSESITHYKFYNFKHFLFH